MEATPPNEETAQKQQRFIDLLHKAETYHAKLAKFYANKSKHVHSEKSRMQLEYLAEHEEGVNDALKEYESDAPPAVLDAWFNYSPDILSDAWIDSIRIEPNMMPDAISNVVREQHDKLLQTYEQLREKAVSEPVKAAVANLYDMEKRLAIRAMRSAEPQ